MNGASEEALEGLLLRASGSARFAEIVTARRPFADLDALLAAADAAWNELDDAGWADALVANADDVVPEGPEETRRAVMVALRLYRERFGIPFVAAVRSPAVDELLMRIRIRLGNDADAELHAAREELRRMTRRRLEAIWREHT